MVPKKTIPFFAELGKMMNFIRSISAELTEEIGTAPNKKAALYNIWYARDCAIAKLQGNLQQLENEIAYFFTGSGSKKTLDNLVNIQTLRQKLADNFKALTVEYLNIKSDYPEKRATQENITNNKSEETTRNKALPFSLMN